MKNLILTILALGTVQFAFGQTTNDQQVQSYSAGTVSTSKGGSEVKFIGNVTIYINDKLKIESDSAVFDREKNLLKTYGTKKFSFDGTVTGKQENNRLCRYHLGTEMLIIE